MPRSIRKRRAPIARLLFLLVLPYCAAHFLQEDSSSPLLPLVPDAETVKISVYFAESDEVRQMPLETYIAHVVSAEMPDTFHFQALCAQAVAARSYLAFRMRGHGGSGCASHPEADICISHACCQAYAESVHPSAARAAHSTAGEALFYAGAPINALYHASSGGRTADAASVFSQALPYLQSTASPGEEGYPQFSAERRFTRAELAVHLCLDEKAPLSEQLEVLETDASGRAVFIRAGGSILRGAEFRRLLSLPSANLSLSFDGDALIVSTVGSGHGVGMSQVGADAMARRGAEYGEILAWYYGDCALCRLY